MISAYLANALLDHILKNTAYTSPAVVYIGLSKKPLVFQTATPGDEVSGGAYARQAFAVDAAENGIDWNNAKITFPNATADWSTAAAPITHGFVADASSAGNWLFSWKLECPLVVSNGDPGPVVNQRGVHIGLRGQYNS